MRTRTMVSFSLPLALALVACSHDEPETATTPQAETTAAGGMTSGAEFDSKADEAPTTTPVTVESEPAEPSAPIDLTDAQVVHVIDTLNQGEIQIAKAAQTMLKSRNARQYAQRMIREHTKTKNAFSKALRGKELTPEANPLSQALDRAVGLQVEALTSDRANADETYLSGQAQMHRDSLALVDCVLAPTVTDTDLSSFVRSDTRSALAAHLRAAQATEGAADEAGSAGEDETPQTDCTNVCDAGPSPLSPDLRSAACGQ